MLGQTDVSTAPNSIFNTLATEGFGGLGLSESSSRRWPSDLIPMCLLEVAEVSLRDRDSEYETSVLKGLM
jgi:hypothetical protein